MPIHDWTRVDAGCFMPFITAGLKNSPRAQPSVLPSDYFALPEQNIRGPIPDVSHVETRRRQRRPSECAGGIAVAARTPRTRLTQRAEADSYLRKASRITVRHRHGQVIALLKSFRQATRGARPSFGRWWKNPRT